MTPPSEAESRLANLTTLCSVLQHRKATTLVAVYWENAVGPLVEIPELDEVFIDRKINAGDCGLLASTKPA